MRLFQKYYVYIMTNKTNKVLYVGATKNILRRKNEHVNKTVQNSFTEKYNVNKLVYYEVFEESDLAFKREKQIKAGSRQKKINLINSINSKWRDLTQDLYKIT